MVKNPTRYIIQDISTAPRHITNSTTHYKPCDSLSLSIILEPTPHPASQAQPSELSMIRDPISATPPKTEKHSSPPPTRPATSLADNRREEEGNTGARGKERAIDAWEKDGEGARWGRSEVGKCG